MAAPFLLEALKTLSKQLGLAIVTTLVEPLEKQQLDHLQSPFECAADGSTLAPLSSSAHQDWLDAINKAGEADISMINVAYYIYQVSRFSYLLFHQSCI